MCSTHAPYRQTTFNGVPANVRVTIEASVKIILKSFKGPPTKFPTFLSENAFIKIIGSNINVHTEKLKVSNF